MIPPKVSISQSSDTLDTLASSVDTIRGKGSHKDTHHEGTGTFLGMPTINMKMDMPKWNWPDWTFGKGAAASKRPTAESSSVPLSGTKGPQDTAADSSDQRSQIEVQVNTEDLEDAMSDSMSTISRDKKQADIEEPKEGQDDDNVSAREEDTVHDDEDTEATPVIPSSTRIAFPEEPEPSPPPSPPPLPEFSMTKVHLSSPEDPFVTKRVSIHYVVVGFSGTFFFAVINAHERAAKWLHVGIARHNTQDLLRLGR